MPSAGDPIFTLTPSCTGVGKEEPSTNKALTDWGDTSTISTAFEVLATERSALEHLEQVYRTSTQAQKSLDQAVGRIAKSICAGGKCVVAGIGKSGKIGQKVVATMNNSLGVQSSFLRLTEVVHGDLGVIGALGTPCCPLWGVVGKGNDTFLLISNSARTPELLFFVPHVPPSISIIVMTSHSDPSSLQLLESRYRDVSGVKDILLPTPVHGTEQTSFGVAAPMTSMTVALAVGDVLALAAARKLQLEGREPVADVFGRFHPGGSVGNGC